MGRLVAVTADQLFHTAHTGIQHYTDSLLCGLASLDLDFCITAFAPTLIGTCSFEEQRQDGSLLWSDRLPIDRAGADFALAELPALRIPGVRQLARQLDQAILDRVHWRTIARRAQKASLRYDLLHVTTAFADLHERSSSRHHTLTIHDLTTRTIPDAHSAENVAMWESLFEFAVRRCGRVIAVSQATKADIVDLLHIPADRVDVTPEAPRVSTRRIEDNAEVAQVLSRHGIAPLRFVLYAGSLEPRKNVSTVIRGFAIASREPELSDVRLVLVGRAWPGVAERLRREASDLGVDDRVLLPGYLSNHDLNALMSSCGVFAYMSLQEGFGLPPLEAMACGAPVITSDTSSLPEVVGDAGIRLPPQDAGQLAAAIHKVLTDDAERERRSALSLKRAATFSWERTARLTAQSYEASLAN